MNPYLLPQLPLPGVTPFTPPVANPNLLSAIVDPSDDPNGLYKRVHQRLNSYNQWESYHAPTQETYTKYAFVVCIRLGPRGTIPQESTYLQIESKQLKAVLKDCLTNVPAVLDPTPVVINPFFFLSLLDLK
jgi:hypothetical protein